MTKKDFELIADAISATQGFFAGGVDDFVNHLVDSLIVRLANNNPRFDSEKFRKACQVK